MGVTVLHEMVEGTGPLIKVGDKVVIHSTGTVKQSAITFDDSREGGFAYTVAVGVNRAIRGMDTALLQMRKGCHRQLLITADHAYGAEGLRPHVPPNADVIYDVEVVDINESLVAQGIRARREEEARTARYLKIQDAERALEAAGGSSRPKRGAEAQSSGSSESSSDSESSDSEARKRRKKRERKEKKKKREKGKEKDKDKEKRKEKRKDRKQEKRERHKKDKRKSKETKRD